MRPRVLFSIALIVSAASSAVFLDCRRGASPSPFYYSLYFGRAVIGNVQVRPLGERRDGDGDYYLTKYELTFYRWSDGCGVGAVRGHILAASRPGKPPFYIAGQGDGTSFRCRLCDQGYRLTVVGDNGVAHKQGPAPTYFLFRGAPLPLLGKAPSKDALFLDLATGEQTTSKGNRTVGTWEGQHNGDAVRVVHGNGVVNAVYAVEGISLRPTTGPYPVQAFYYRRPKFNVTPYIFPHPGRRDVFEIPLYVRISYPLSQEDLFEPGQAFNGVVAGDVALGVFTVRPSLQPPLELPASALVMARTWPLVEGSDGLESGVPPSLHSAPRTYVAGVGVFWGNIVAPYSWVEVGGRAFAPPGRPIPILRIALVRGSEPAAVKRIALAGAPKRNGRPLPYLSEGVPGLRTGDEIEYQVFKDGATTGWIAASYDASPQGTPSFFVYGDVAGVTLEDTAAAVYSDGVGMRRVAAADGFAELLALGSAVGKAGPGGKPLYEFTLAADPPTILRHLKWSGISRLTTDDGVVECFVFTVEPEGFVCYYDAGGILVRAKWTSYEARLVRLPKTRPDWAALPAAAQPAPSSPNNYPEESPGI